MFGFGILTYVKIGAAVVILAVCGYYVWSYHSMKTEIVTLKTEIESLKSRAEVIEKAQQATDKFMKAKTKVVTRNVKERAEVDQVVESGDDPAMRQLYLNHGLLKPSQTGSPAGGGPGRPGNLPARAPGL